MRGNKHKRITVYAVTSFEGVRKGDLAEVELTPRIEGILRTGYLRRVENIGASIDRPSADQGGESGSSDSGADDGIPVGDEPSEGSDAS
jgi:hypothetical protein